MRSVTVFLPVLLVAIGMASVTLAGAQIATHVVINEFELNPPSDDAGSEWVELYNPTNAIVDLAGWTLQSIAGVTVTVTIPQGAIIDPRGYYVATHPQQWLDNENEGVILRDRNGQEIDRTPVVSDKDNDERSWQRYPNGADGWVYAPSTRTIINVAELPTPVLAAAVILGGSILVLRRRLRVVSAI